MLDFFKAPRTPISGWLIMRTHTLTSYGVDELQDGGFICPKISSPEDAGAWSRAEHLAWMRKPSPPHPWDRYLSSIRLNPAKPRRAKAPVI